MVEIGLVSASFISLKTFYWIPWTSVCSGSSGDLKTDLLQWWRFNSPNLCLKIWGFDRCRKRDCQWKLRSKKNVLVSQTSPWHFSIVLLSYLLWEIHLPFLSNISVKALLASHHILCLIQLQLCLSFFNPIPTYLTSIFIFFLGYMSLAPLRKFWSKVDEKIDVWVRKDPFYVDVTLWHSEL